MRILSKRDINLLRAIEKAKDKRWSKYYKRKRL